jgi:hypothetical protein
MKRPYVIALILLGVLTLLSLVLNGIVIFQFLRLRCVAHGVVADTRALITELTDDTFSHTVEIDQEIPISTDLPFNEAMTVPINTVVPISTTVVVPVDLGFTTYNLAVPIDTVFPVDMEVTVPFSQTVGITTAVPIDVDVPVEIAIADTPLVDYLDELDAKLEEIDAQLGCLGWQE